MFITPSPSLPLWVPFASASCYAFLCTYTPVPFCFVFFLPSFLISLHIAVSSTKCVSPTLVSILFFKPLCVFPYVHLHVYTSVFLCLAQVCPLLCLSLSVPPHISISVNHCPQRPLSFYVYVFLFLCILFSPLFLKSFLCLSLCEHMIPLGYVCMSLCLCVPFAINLFVWVSFLCVCVYMHESRCTCYFRIIHW